MAVCEGKHQAKRNTHACSLLQQLARRKLLEVKLLNFRVRRLLVLAQRRAVVPLSCMTREEHGELLRRLARCSWARSGDTHPGDARRLDHKKLGALLLAVAAKEYTGEVAVRQKLTLRPL